MATTTGQLAGPDSTPTGLPGVDAPPVSLRRDVWRRFRQNRLAFGGLIVLGVIVLMAIFAPIIAPFDPTQIDPANARQGPSAEHWLGTDQIGRDVFSRIVYGARVSLRIGLIAGTMAIVIGVVVGALAGYRGGVTDGAMMRLTDVLLALPYLLLALAIVTVVGPGERTVILVIGGLGWLAVARILRSTILQVKESDYVLAARALGASDTRIVMRHVLPNAIQPVIVYAAIFVGAAVLTEAALSFLGAGVQEPTPAWGLMIAQSRRFLATSPHLVLAPGIAIAVLVTAMVFIGDGLRDALDPRLK
jgi:ABC-type dipeptide/oligopeptide/nickel transport system permease subunit